MIRDTGREYRGDREEHKHIANTWRRSKGKGDLPPTPEAVRRRGAASSQQSSDADIFSSSPSPDQVSDDDEEEWQSDGFYSSGSDHESYRSEGSAPADMQPLPKKISKAALRQAAMKRIKTRRQETERGSRTAQELLRSSWPSLPGHHEAQEKEAEAGAEEEAEKGGGGAAWGVGSHKGARGEIY